MEKPNYTVELLEVKTDGTGRAKLNRSGVVVFISLATGGKVVFSKSSTGMTPEDYLMEQLVYNVWQKNISIDDVMKISNLPRIGSDMYVYYNGSLLIGDSTYVLCVTKKD